MIKKLAPLFATLCLLSGATVVQAGDTDTDIIEIVEVEDVPLAYRHRHHRRAGHHPASDRELPPDHGRTQQLPHVPQERRGQGPQGG